MKQLTPEETIDVNILIAMNKCMGEIAHGLQFVHKQKLKQKIKHVIRTVDVYEKEIDKQLDGMKALKVLGIRKRNRRRCPNCGGAPEHFVPPCMGELGFFICEKVEDKNADKTEAKQAEVDEI